MKYPDLLSHYMNSKPNSRYFSAFSVICLGFVLDYFDLYLVGFLLAVLGPEWHLTYGESAIVLLSAGVGAIVGSILSGTLADAFGRRPVLLVSTSVCGIAAGAVAFVPDGAWIILAALRFFVGSAIGGIATSEAVLLVEHTPSKFSTRLTGFPFVAASIGPLVASISAAALLHTLGWRGVAALGFAPILVTLAAWYLVPESAVWLASRGRLEEARKVLLYFLGTNSSELPVSATESQYAVSKTPSAKMSDALAFPKRIVLVIVTWAALSTVTYAVYLWGPTILSLLLHIPVPSAARYFVLVPALGIIGRLLFSVLPIWMRRRTICWIFGVGMFITLGGAALAATQFVFDFPVFVIMVALAALFFDGGWCVIVPYTAEIFPTSFAARAIGLGQAANGIGKILGPLCIAIAAGSGNFVSPTATLDAVLPAFLFLSACGLVIGIFFAFFAPADLSERMATAIDGEKDTSADLTSLDKGVAQ
ncbi:MFS transporter [Paraburkholderia sp. SIMBA_049]